MDVTGVVTRMPLGGYVIRHGWVEPQ